jgi:predicted metalloprotease with PDZ domain
MKKSLFFIPILTLIFFLTGCATAPQLIKNEAYDYKISRVFNSDFERTWTTIIKVMEAHPITTIEKVSGILLTDWVQGASPLYLRKLFIPLAQRETKKAVGMYLAQLTPNVIYIVHALENGPAFECGIRSQDIVLGCNRKKIAKVSEVVDCITSSEKVTLTTLRHGANEPLEFEIKPKKITFDYAYVPIKTRYKLNVRVSKVSQDTTEVKIINYEEADFGRQTQYGWQSNYQVIETSTLREKILLDEIESQLSNRS